MSAVHSTDAPWATQILKPFNICVLSSRTLCWTSPASFRRVARQPFVAHGPAHLVVRAKFAHREPIALRVRNESQSLIHKSRLHPRHHALINSSFVMQVRVLPMLPALLCYLSKRSVPRAAATNENGAGYAGRDCKVTSLV